MIEKDFWRGLLPLLLTFGAAQLTFQVDIAMAARLGAGAPAAYVLLIRAALLDIVLMAAIGAVTSVVVAKARWAGRSAGVIRQISTLALATGTCTGALGLIFYPRIVKMLAGDGEAGSLACSAIAWYAAAAPFRFLSNFASFALHALGRGVPVVHWKLFEAGLKAALNFLFMIALGFGFAGCFMGSFVLAVISSLWFCRQLRPHGLRIPGIPERSFALSFLRSTGFEAQRILSPQLAVLASLALFAAPWLGRPEFPRLDPYAAGQILILLVLAPMTALSRFLAFRFAGRQEAELASLVQWLCIWGVPLVAGMASILYIGGGWLGRAIYGQQGPWWAALVQALAISLPLRYAANVMRAVLQAQGSFLTVAAADSLAPWLAGLPLIVLGLYLDKPGIAYLSLIVPEAICAAWLWHRMRLPRQLEPAFFPGIEAPLPVPFEGGPRK